MGIFIALFNDIWVNIYLLTKELALCYIYLQPVFQCNSSNIISSLLVLKIFLKVCCYFHYIFQVKYKFPSYVSPLARDLISKVGLLHLIICPVCSKKMLLISFLAA